MNISIISFGKFHSFDLARELSKHKANVKIYSAYPYFKAKKYSIKKSSFRSFFVLFIIDRLTSSYFESFLKKLYCLILKFLILKDQDVFIIWADIPSNFIFFLKKKFNKSIVILERGSSHIKFQNKILKNEYASLGLNFEISERYMQNEIKNYDQVDYISIPSIFSLETFLNYNVPKSKLIVNPYGADLSKFYKKKLNKNKEFTILTCGIGSVRKGFHHMLKAHDFIDGSFKHYHVGKIENFFEDKLGKYNNLKVFDSMSQQRLIKYYNLADVFVLPSLEDGFGMVILEAMACGLPVIATKNTGITSINSKFSFGYTININNPQEIAEKINILKSDPKTLKTFSDNSIKIISKGGYKWNDYGNRYYKFLHQKLN